MPGDLVSSPERGVLVPPRSRDLGMVFQSYAVWPHMTVRQNVVYPLKHRKMARGEAARKVDEVLELVGLSEYAERPVVALSGGQMQRVALARSIVYRPQLLLLDEPLSNLDAKLRLRLRDDLRIILKQTGMTALYVTHDQAEAVVLGDRIGVMRDGKLLQIGTPDRNLQPAGRSVRRQFYRRHQRTHRHADRAQRRVRHGRFRRRPSRRGGAAAGARTGRQSAHRARPENIGIGKPNGANAFPARVVDRRYQGTQTVYDIDLLGRRLEALELGTAARHQVGAETQVSLPREGCWAYRDTGPSSYE